MINVLLFKVVTQKAKGYNQRIFIPFRKIMLIALTVFNTKIGVFAIYNNFKSKKVYCSRKNYGDARYPTV